VGGHFEGEFDAARTSLPVRAVGTSASCTCAVITSITLPVSATLIANFFRTVTACCPRTSITSREFVMGDVVSGEGATGHFERGDVGATGGVVRGFDNYAAVVFESNDSARD
jgi:hypothetical protein